MPEPLTSIRSTAAVLPRDDVDTDQIIPARFLTTTERRGLGRHLFADWRYDAAGAAVEGFVLNTAAARAARILVAGRNFGCGSSREHAPWALADFGFRVIVARSFADIFRANALKNALLPVALDEGAHGALLSALGRDPAVPITADLRATTLSLPDGSAWTFEIPPFSRRCLLDGIDQLGFLLEAEADIAAWERAHPSALSTVASVDAGDAVAPSAGVNP